VPGGEAPTALSYQGNITEPTQVELEGSVTGPAGGATIVTLTPVPGTYTANWTVSFTGGSPVGADSDNFGLYLGATLLLQSDNAPNTSNSYPQPPIQVTEPVASTAVTVKAIGAGTAGVVYTAQLVLTPVQSTDLDDPLYPFNPLTANGLSVNITSTPANLATTLAGFDLSEGAECQVGRGSLVPAGTSNFGFVDTTYTPTQAQILAGSNQNAF
jgi:hypothetical protein